MKYLLILFVFALLFCAIFAEQNQYNDERLNNLGKIRYTKDEIDSIRSAPEEGFAVYQSGDSTKGSEGTTPVGAKFEVAFRANAGKKVGSGGFGFKKGYKKQTFSKVRSAECNKKIVNTFRFLCQSFKLDYKSTRSRKILRMIRKCCRESCPISTLTKYCRPQTPLATLNPFSEDRDAIFGLRLPLFPPPNNFGQ